jgi:hypothetical protein
LSLGDSHPIYKTPVIAEWAGVHLLTLTATLQLP